MDIISESIPIYTWLVITDFKTFTVEAKDLKEAVEKAYTADKNNVFSMWNIVGIIMTDSYLEMINGE